MKDEGTQAKLKRILPSRSAHVLYVDDPRGNGTALYRLACQLDLEGIVAKRADSRYVDNPNLRNWIKIKNPAYSQKEGRADLFKRADWSSFRVCRGWLTVNTRRGFQFFRKST